MIANRSSHLVVIEFLYLQIDKRDNTHVHVWINRKRANRTARTDAGLRHYLPNCNQDNIFLFSISPAMFV